MDKLTLAAHNHYHPHTYRPIIAVEVWQLGKHIHTATCHSAANYWIALHNLKGTHKRTIR